MEGGYHTQSADEDVELVHEEQPTLPCMQRIFVVLRPDWQRTAKQYLTLQECSGSLGDLGTFLPLVTALSVTKQIAFGPTLFFAGLYTMMLSTYFDVPIPVQPMKTISAIAITEKYSQAEIAASGLLIGAILFVLAITNAMTVVAKRVPFSLVRGVQLGVGLSLMMSGVKQAYVRVATVSLNNITMALDVKRSATTLSWWGWDSIAASIVMVLFCLGCMHNKRVPTALVIFVYGVVIAAVRYNAEKARLQLPSLQWGPDFVHLPSWPTAADFQNGFVHMVLPQLPLTLLNSVIALEQLAADLFPTKRCPVASSKRICFSVGIGDMLFSGFGMLPMCHGAGGLASQYAFGARSNVAMMFLGLVKVVVALALGTTLVQLLQDGIFPSCVIGVLVMFAGVHLSVVGLDVDAQKNKGDAVVLLVTAAASLAIDTGVGFLVGAATYAMLRYVVNDAATYRMHTHH
ncbi:hypothetical protein H310_02405 [Aphanomyces invadans]|uniref:SLC26A/SulP transporter domain-containing protein n=1 Tax=Aphanomyces invadans TaxID=157072 RepID=A0A024UPC7_9STRA|nr:hypothetical protein H310_02405 [Aphanomyces invadans]ETW08030.1 hypothetical protein H310_02405 [Aphanomyces invadans]|eukprot:XP_008864123.1 hypothetical protein H310_02405 [Aphanomyces invadans]